MVIVDWPPIVPDGDNPTMIRRAFQRLNDRISTLRTILDQSVTTSDSPTFVGVTISGLTASKALVLNASKALATNDTLTALSVFNTNGLLAQTAASTFAGRTITGTANQISVSNGDGVSGNPTLSTPQDIHTGATPQFAGLGIGTAGAANKVSGVAGLTIETTGSNGNITLTPNGTGQVILSSIPRFNGTNTTGGGSAALGANCPAVTLTAPYTWVQVTTSDGSTGYVPVWK